MNSQTNPKVTLGCFAVIIFVILLATYLAAGSFNPLAVYASDSILAKVIVSLLLAFLAFSLLIQLVFYGLRKSVEIGTGKSAEDLICPGCGLPLIQFMGSHGVAIRCPGCQVSWHDGPACYRKGMPHTDAMLPNYLCPNCRSAASGDQDLFDDEDFMRFR